MLTASLRCCSTFNRQICVMLMSPAVRHACCHRTATGTRLMSFRWGLPDGGAQLDACVVAQKLLFTARN